MIISARNQYNTIQAMKAKGTSLKMDISQVKKWSKVIAYLCLVSLLPAHAVNAATYLFHNDHLGTPQALTDSDQQVVWQSAQDPFGEVEEVVNVVEQNLRFPGQYFDSETDLHYNYFRNYDPGIGRYVESDPIGLKGGINSYLYANANALVNFDPFGLECENKDSDNKKDKKKKDECSTIEKIGKKLGRHGKVVILVCRLLLGGGDDQGGGGKPTRPEPPDLPKPKKPDISEPKDPLNK